MLAVAGLIGAQARVPAMTLMRAPLGTRGLVPAHRDQRRPVPRLDDLRAARDRDRRRRALRRAARLRRAVAVDARLRRGRPRDGAARADRRRAHGAAAGGGVGDAARDRLPDLVGADRRGPVRRVEPTGRRWPLRLAGNRHRRRGDGLMGAARGRLHALRPLAARRLLGHRHRLPPPRRAPARSRRGHPAHARGRGRGRASGRRRRGRPRRAPHAPRPDRGRNGRGVRERLLGRRLAAEPLPRSAAAAADRGDDVRRGRSVPWRSS